MGADQSIPDPDIQANVVVQQADPPHEPHEAKQRIDRLERLLKVLGSGGLALLIAWIAFRYFQSENAIVNTFIREELIDSLKSESDSKAALAIQLKETADAIADQTKEQQLTRIEIGTKLDNLATTQKDLTKSVEELVRLQTEQITDERSNARAPER